MAGVPISCLHFMETLNSLADVQENDNRFFSPVIIVKSE